MCSPNEPKWLDMSKVCTTCGVRKAHDEFYTSRVWKGLTPSEPKYQARCKECTKKAVTARKKASQR